MKNFFFSLLAFFCFENVISQSTGLPINLYVCDNDGDSIAQFDLSINNFEILFGLDPNDYIITYHETEADADNNTNALSNPYTNVINPQVLYARVEDLVSGNVEINNFFLVVDSTGAPSSIDEEFCQLDETIDLTAISVNTVQTNLTLTYHFTEASAISGIDSIDNPQNFQHNFEQQVFIRSEDTLNGCFDITTVSLSYNIDEDLCEGICQVSDVSVSTSPENPDLGVLFVEPDSVIVFNASLNFSDSDENFTYLWDFGDGTTSTDLSASHAYQFSGMYNVIFTVFENNEYECTEVSQNIPIQVLGENVVITDEYSSVEYLVEEVLLGGQCSQVFNIEYTSGSSFADAESIGYFQNASGLFPFSEGLLLSTGQATSATGPNFSALSDGSAGWVGDSDLDNFLGIISNNATIIEFDFIALVNEINFEFLMASEEYDGNTGGNFECNFSDAFAFLLTDSQGNTSNLAVIPETEIPILVTNIHPANNGCPAINEEYFGGYIDENAPPISYDGMTVPFIASANVNIGEPYHIKLVIADDNDTAFDSGVFLKANSLDVGELCENIGLINAKAFIDSNGNGLLDSGEQDFTNGSFTYEKNNDGVINEVNSSIGNFSIVSEVEADTYNISFNIYEEFEDCFSIGAPTFENISVANGEVVTVNFPITDNGICQDLAVYLINGQIPPRPGFDHENEIIIENLASSTITSGTIEFTHDENLTFNSILSINPDFIVNSTANGFIVDFINLEPGESESILVSLNCSTTVGLGEIVTNTVVYTTDENDTVANNNSSTLSEIVVGSFDPNDKMESHGPQVVLDEFSNSDEYLYYTIRFQNLGTFAAEFVRIEDELDAQLDESTFQMLRSSHDYVVTRTGSDLEWFFEDIQLPAAEDDEEGSNGYVYFRIKPEAGYSIGDVIPNSAAIYFDFNDPIITNTFTTTFVETLSTERFDVIGFDLFPNPANDEVLIQLKNSNNEIVNIQLLDIQGKMIMTSKISEGNQKRIDISQLESGLYFVSVFSGEANSVKKLIVE
ncbi:MAG: choice-of-anchor L domain-containing protein [Bacteroidota bacterium]